MLITCTGKLDAEQLLDKCVEKRSSFIEEAHANLSKSYSRFFKLESPHCGLVNPVSFFRLRNDDVFFLDFIPVLILIRDSFNGK